MAKKPAPADAAGIRIVLPLDALTLSPGVEPRAGDTVDITGEARVEFAGDGKARLVLTRVNDVTPEAPAIESPDASDDDEFDDLQRRAAAEDAGLGSDGSDDDSDEYR